VGGILEHEIVCLKLAKKESAMRNIDELLTSEMNGDEWREFRRRWIADYAEGLVVECGIKGVEAREIAEIRFEDYCGQEGFTMRNEVLLAQRKYE
jgi:hypothetical protein